MLVSPGLAGGLTFQKSRNVETFEISEADVLKFWNSGCTIDVKVL